MAAQGAVALELLAAGAAGDGGGAVRLQHGRRLVQLPAVEAPRGLQCHVAQWDLLLKYVRHFFQTREKYLCFSCPVYIGQLKHKYFSCPIYIQYQVGQYYQLAGYRTKESKMNHSGGIFVGHKTSYPH